jgi:hypothetical protein
MDARGGLRGTRPDAGQPLQHDGEGAGETDDGGDNAGRDRLDQPETLPHEVFFPFTQDRKNTEAFQEARLAI